MYNQVIRKDCDWSNVSSAEKSNKKHMIVEGHVHPFSLFIFIFKLSKSTKWMQIHYICINLQIINSFVSPHFFFVS